MNYYTFITLILYNKRLADTSQNELYIAVNGLRESAEQSKAQLKGRAALASDVRRKWSVHLEH